MSALDIAVGAVAAQRLAELAWSRRNVRQLRALGGIEHGAAHYPLIVAFHASWLTAMMLFIPAEAEPNTALLAAYALLQPLRYWAIASLGQYWTTRVIVVAGSAPVHHGPYRFLRHPNYWVVALEIPLLPGAFGAWIVAAIFGVGNLAILAYRIAVEQAARHD